MNQTTTIPVDTEHTGIRLVVFLVFLIGAAAGYLLLAALITSDGINFIAILGSLVIAFLLSGITERVLKSRWPSGRSLQIDAQGARLVRRGTVEKQIAADEPASILQWRFQTKRRSRVPKGWYVVACALEQEDNYLSVYTFMSPDDLKKFDPNAAFLQLPSRKEAEEKGKGRDALLIAGQQRRLMEAENHRWIDGAEVSSDDFKTYFGRLTDFPQWTR